MKSKESKGVEPQPAPEVQEVWPVDHVLDDRYKIVELLDVTWRSEVYLVRELQPPFHTLVVKRLKSDRISHDDSRSRFEREIIVLRRIPHQHVVSLHDIKTTGPDRFFVTEYADRGTLKDYIARRPDHKLCPAEALEIALAVCKGLDAAHTHDIIHRDVKPGNIFMFSQRNGDTVAKLGDFSIARVSKELAGEILTEVGSFVGTASYASPEQIGGGLAVPQSDLYSWALVFFEMLTGESPTESLRDPVTYKPRSDRYPSTYFGERGIPFEFVELLEQNLCTDQTLRSPSAREVWESLDEIRHQIDGELETRIERHLEAGEAYIRSADWSAAEAEFRQGLALCGWHGELGDASTPLGELAHWLRPGHMCARGMILYAEGQWQAATETLETLHSLVPTYLSLDVAALLEQARREQSREQMYHRLLEHRDNGDWEEILRLTDLESDGVDDPESELVADIRKLALYARGKTLLDEEDPEASYREFFRLHQTDPDYKDVAEQCVAAAFRVCKKDDSLNPEDQVQWLERVVEIEPDHNDGLTWQKLDVARFRWAKELLPSNPRAAAGQLERVSAEFQAPDDGSGALAQMYSKLGDEEWRERQWMPAVTWWNRAVSTSAASRKALRWRVLWAKARIWVDRNYPLVLVGILFILLLLFASLTSGGRLTWLIAPSATPSRTPLPTVATATSIPSMTPTETETPTPTNSPTPSPTHTATATHTPTMTPSVTSTPSTTPSPTATPTATPSPTPTSTNTRWPTVTPTPTVTPSSTPVPPPPKPSKTPVVPTPTWTRPALG